jgi:hypothetical protein
MNVIHLPQKEQQKAVILKEDPEEIALSDKNFYFYKNFMIKKDGFWMSFILISIVIIILILIIKLIKFDDKLLMKNMKEENRKEIY